MILKIFFFFIIKILIYFDIFGLLLLGDFLWVFDNSYLSFLYIEKKAYKRIYVYIKIYFIKNILLAFLYDLEINLVYELCKLYEL